MTWIKAKNGNVIDVPDHLVDDLVANGHEVIVPEPTDPPKPKRAPRPRQAD